MRSVEDVAVVQTPAARRYGGLVPFGAKASNDADQEEVRARGGSDYGEVEAARERGRPERPSNSLRTPQRSSAS